MGLQRRQDVGVAGSLGDHEWRGKAALGLARGAGAAIDLEHGGDRGLADLARATDTHGGTVRESAPVQDGVVAHAPSLPGVARHRKMRLCPVG